MSLPVIYRVWHFLHPLHKVVDANVCFLNHNELEILIIQINPLIAAKYIYTDENDRTTNSVKKSNKVIANKRSHVTVIKQKSQLSM